MYYYSEDCSNFSEVNCSLYLHLTVAYPRFLLLIVLSLNYIFILFFCFTSRFGSFEIFKPTDSMTGRKGPSVGRTDILVQLLDYTVKTFFPQVIILIHAFITM